MTPQHDELDEILFNWVEPKHHDGAKAAINKLRIHDRIDELKKLPVYEHPIDYEIFIEKRITTLRTNRSQTAQSMEQPHYDPLSDIAKTSEAKDVS